MCFTAEWARARIWIAPCASWSRRPAAKEPDPVPQWLPRRRCSFPADRFGLSGLTLRKNGVVRVDTERDGRHARHRKRALELQVDGVPHKSTMSSMSRATSCDSLVEKTRLVMLFWLAYSPSARSPALAMTSPLRMTSC